MASIVQAVTGGVSGNSGGAGVNFQAGQAPLIQSATTADAATTFQQQQQTLQQQQAFAAAVAAANGVGNQSNVFNQLQGVANGTGPNPAQTQLAQSTGANVAQTASQMAGQRGSGANVGLAARQIGQQGAATQQAAAGQAATLQANQSLNAINSAGNIATNQVNQEANATQGAGQLALSGQGNTLGAIAAQNNAAVGSVDSSNKSNSAVAGQVAGGQQQLLGNLVGGAGAAFGLAEGGKVPPMKFADGTPPGGVPQATTQLQPIAAAPTSSSSGPASKVGQYFSNQSNPSSKQQTGMSAAGSSIGKGIGTGLKSMFGGASGTPTSGLSGGADIDSSLAKQAASSQGYANQMGAPGANGGVGTDHDAEMFKSMYGDDAVANGSYAQAQQDQQGMAADQQAAFAPQAPETDEDASESIGQKAAQGGIMQSVTQLAPLVAALMAGGGKVPVLLSPGEKKLTPQQAKAAAGGQIDPLKAGKTVPGRPVVGGAKNSYANDVVKDAVEPGTLILPRSVTQSKNPQWAAHKFVLQHMAMAKGGKV